MHSWHLVLARRMLSVRSIIVFVGFGQAYLASYIRTPLQLYFLRANHVFFPPGNGAIVQVVLFYAGST